MFAMLAVITDGRSPERGRTRRVGGTRLLARHVFAGLASATALLAGFALGGCGMLAPDNRELRAFDFRQGPHGFVADFTDFPEDQEEDVHFEAGHGPLPGELAGQGPALHHRGLNISDDLFMYFKRRVEGLEPNRRYAIAFSLEFASAAGADCDVGAAVLVWLKAGAAAEEPVRTVEDGHVRLSVDKGQQSQEGGNALLLGDMRNGEPGCGPEVPWALKRHEDGRTIEVIADAEGGLWLFFGSESGFEVRHELYFTRFEASFRPLD